ncbi:chemotaxis protein CheC [Virgibacillus halophilus]|uniref:Chemotaxis protein CheC n=1 Tax=Tigheibacillus halophilus TaxID=361280 RepID=A0ABU5CAN4_9BACI|nr:chemotaxis protein CheC [Virgibacillus halophilus]
MMKKLTNMQRDALREIGNIGSGNAATSMAKMMQNKVEMAVPDLKIIAFEEVMDMLGGAETTVVANMFRINGNAPGTVFLIMSLEEADSIAQHFSGLELFDCQDDPEPLGVSAIQEFANILTSAYVSALADFTGLHMQPSVPLISIDMAGAVISQGLVEISQANDYAIIIDTVMNVPAKKRHGTVKWPVFTASRSGLSTKNIQCTGY